MVSASARRASGAEDDFLLGIVHDMRVHLRKSVTRAQRLSGELSSSPAPGPQEHVAEILAAGRDMEVLLTRLAKYAVAGRDPSDKPPGSIEIMLHSALSRLAYKNAEAEIDSGPYHSSDLEVPCSFEIVLFELLDNALKFRNGPVKVKLTIEQLPEENIFGVVDTGIGFERQYSEKMMRPLERLHPASVYPGSGLGLSICQRMVEAWGGKLWAESTPGSGSTFWFSVPA